MFDISANKKTIENTYKTPNKSSSTLGSRFIYKFLGMDSSIDEQFFLKVLPRIFFLAFLSLIHIGNRHIAEKKVRVINNLESEVEDLRADFTTLKADFMFQSKRSEIAIKARKLKLYESVEPITVLNVDEL